MAEAKIPRSRSQRFDKDMRGTVWVYTTRDLASQFALAAREQGISTAALGASLVEGYVKDYLAKQAFKERLSRMVEDNKEALERLATKEDGNA